MAVDAGASLTRAPTDSLTSHISVEALCHLTSSAASLVINDSAAKLKFAQFCVGANIPDQTANQQSYIDTWIG